MNNTTITNQNPELTKNYIIHIIQLLDKITIDYQNTKSERQAIALKYSPLETEFTVLEEIELLTIYIRGYANQIKARGYVQNPVETIKTLQKITMFDIQKIAQLYFHTPGEYENLKSYLRMLDYLRLLILEYLN
ncbi:hypothetical protein H6F32_17500 [Anabaena sp. FACHB-1237]|uniref:hypothetical protein n=1 Tax=Anabaena sp. FACHB-1237 TaxID=2692769 RepID=UPI00168142C1|nr:hypothetical protein [Anabaena sp. FACHB-1237]MBD2139322.1 hypothetical protein [Anabaena sp. FACHB-1237]